MQRRRAPHPYVTKLWNTDTGVVWLILYLNIVKKFPRTKIVRGWNNLSKKTSVDFAVILSMESCIRRLAGRRQRRRRMRRTDEHRPTFDGWNDKNNKSLFCLRPSITTDDEQLIIGLRCAGFPSHRRQAIWLWTMHSSAHSFTVITEPVSEWVSKV